jgi:hypothetical protein
MIMIDNEIFKNQGDVEDTYNNKNNDDDVK